MRNVIVSGHGENFSCFWLNSGNNGTKHWPHLWLSHQSWYYSWTDNWKENRSNQRASLRRISMLGGSLWSWYFKGKTRGEVSVRENSVCSTDSALSQIMLVCSTPSLSLLYSKTKYDSALQKFDSALQKFESALQKNWAVEQNQTTIEQNQTTIEQNQTAVEQNQTTVEQNQTTIEQNQACFFNS